MEDYQRPCCKECGTYLSFEGRMVDTGMCYFCGHQLLLERIVALEAIVHSLQRK